MSGFDAAVPLHTKTPWRMFGTAVAHLRKSFALSPLNVCANSIKYDPMPTLTSEGHGRSTGLVEVLDRVLDKGLVVAGDIKVSLAEVELLTIRIRLLICSIDKAEQIGLDWWKFDHHLSPGKQVLSAENDDLKKQVRALERRLASLTRHRLVPGAR